MNLEAESINRWLTGTRRAIQALTHRRRGVSEKRQSTGARLARPALLIVILAITAGVPVPASAPGRTRLAGVRPRRDANPGPRMAAPYRQSARASPTLRGGNIDPRAGQSILWLRVLPGGLSAGRQRPVHARDQPRNPHDLRRQRLQRQRPAAAGAREHRLGDRRRATARRRTCRAAKARGRRSPWETCRAGSRSTSATDTVYVTNVQDNTVSVFNGATCNAENTSGCGQTPATVPVGLDPLGLFADPANHTVYVPNYGARGRRTAGDSTTVSMIDSATCNATDLAACPTTAPPTVDVGSPPDDVAVDQATHTVYVTIGTLERDWRCSTRTPATRPCNRDAARSARCAGDPIGGPNAAQVDPANDTLYTANYDNTVSAFDLHHCNAGDLAGCATRRARHGDRPAPGFDHALWLDRRCSPAQRLRRLPEGRCAEGDRHERLQRQRSSRMRDAHPPGDPHRSRPRVGHPRPANPDALHRQLGGQRRLGDRRIALQRAESPAAAGIARRPSRSPERAGALATDPTAHTTYVVSGSNAVSMINTRDLQRRPARRMRPDAARRSQSATTRSASAASRSIAEPTPSTSRTPARARPAPSRCSMTAPATPPTQAGCGPVSTLQVPGGNPDDIAVNPRTDTIYVATITGSGPNLISVFNGATCNATNTAGCGQTPATVAVRQTRETGQGGSSR